MGPLRAALLAVLASSAPVSPPPAEHPLGVVDQTLGRFDRDTLAPSGPSLEIGEPHAAPALSPGGGRLAVGLSEPAPGGGGRVGLWVVDAARMEVLQRVRTGIAVEAVAYPGVVAALTQDGRLLVVDPDTGAIVSERSVGYTHCGPRAVQVGRTAVFVNQVLARAVEVATVDLVGRIRTARVPLATGEAARGCRRAPMVADGPRGRVLIAGATHVAQVDVQTLRSQRHPIGDRGADRSAALLPGPLLAVGGEPGVRVLDARTWRLRWRTGGAPHELLAGGTTLVALGSRVRAYAARSGRLRWRSRERTFMAAAADGRAYLGTPRAVRIRDLATGRLVGSRPPVLTEIRFAAGPG